jgi:hypothetical protein
MVVKPAKPTVAVRVDRVEDLDGDPSNMASWQVRVKRKQPLADERSPVTPRSAAPARPPPPSPRKRRRLRRRLPALSPAPFIA